MLVPAPRSYLCPEGLGDELRPADRLALHVGPAAHLERAGPGRHAGRRGRAETDRRLDQSGSGEGGPEGPAPDSAGRRRPEQLPIGQSGQPIRGREAPARQREARGAPGAGAGLDRDSDPGPAGSGADRGGQGGIAAGPAAAPVVSVSRRAARFPGQPSPSAPAVWGGSEVAYAGGTKSGGV